MDFDLCLNADVVNDVLQSKLNEMELLYVRILRKAQVSLRTNRLGAGFELVGILSRDAETSGKLQTRHETLL